MTSINEAVCIHRAGTDVALKMCDLLREMLESVVKRIEAQSVVKRML
jgi:hypothetical protein